MMGGTVPGPDGSKADTSVMWLLEDVSNTRKASSGGQTWVDLQTIRYLSTSIPVDA